MATEVERLLTSDKFRVATSEPVCEVVVDDDDELYGSARC